MELIINPRVIFVINMLSEMNFVMYTLQYPFYIKIYKKKVPQFTKQFSKLPSNCQDLLILLRPRRKEATENVN